MWSIIRPATLQVSRVGANAAAAAVPAGAAWRAVGVASRLAINRSASCTYRLIVQSRGFAAAATATKKTTTAATKRKAATTAAAKKTQKKPAAKKKPVKKKVVKAKKPAPKPKKKKPKVVQPTPYQVKKALTATALVKDEPKALPVSPWAIFLGRQLKDSNHKSPAELAAAMPSLSATYRSLSESENQELRDIVARNKVANESASVAWVESQPVELIFDANQARRHLRTRYKSRVQLLDDPRLPPRPVAAHNLFVKAMWEKNRGFDTTRPIKEVFKDTVAAWKALSPEEAKPYHDMHADLTAAYKKAREAIGRPVVSEKSPSEADSTS